MTLWQSRNGCIIIIIKLIYFLWQLLMQCVTKQLNVLEHNLLTKCFYLHLAIVAKITNFTNMLLLESCKL